MFIKNVKSKKYKIFFINILFFIILLFFKVDLSKVDFLNDNNLITFLTSMIGIFLAIITLLHGLLGGLLPTFKKLNIDPNTNLFVTFKELKENTFFIFKNLILVIGIAIFSNIDIPFVNLANMIDKNIFLYDLKFIILILSLFAIKDTLSSFFILLDLSLKVSKSND